MDISQVGINEKTRHRSMNKKATLTSTAKVVSASIPKRSKGRLVLVVRRNSPLQDGGRHLSLKHHIEGPTSSLRTSSGVLTVLGEALFKLLELTKTLQILELRTMFAIPFVRNGLVQMGGVAFLIT